MLKKLLAATAAVVTLSGVVMTQHVRADETKVTEVRVCPMTLAAVKGDGAGSEVVGNYKVYFCCGGCPAAFDKLSAADKQTKIAAALKKQGNAAQAG